LTAYPRSLTLEIAGCVVSILLTHVLLHPRRSIHPEGFSLETTEATNESCTREIAVEIPADVVAKETDSVIQKYQKFARIPGFRKGKVPATVIRQRFAEDIKSEVVEQLVPRYFRQESEKQQLVPVSQPRVSDLHVHDGEPLKFKARFEVMPEIHVPGYQELRGEKAEVTVTDEEVEAALNNLREQHATYNSVEEDRPLQDGDFAQVGFTGTQRDDPEAKPVEVPEVMVEIGGSNTVREFSENLRGAKAGETREFDVTYASDFADERLAGKTVHYSVAVKAIKKKDMPALDDAFAKELGEEFNTVDDLRKRIREGMISEKEHQAEHEAKDKIVEELVKRYEFPVPEALVESQIDMRLDRGLRALVAQGMRAEDIKKMDLTRLRAGQREAALREVKASLILDRIADEEKIEVGDEEIDREVEAVAKQTKQTSEAVRARLTRDGAIDRIRTRIRNEKALNFLFGKTA
jgi:trigger factor